MWIRKVSDKTLGLETGPWRPVRPQGQGETRPWKGVGISRKVHPHTDLLPLVSPASASFCYKPGIDSFQKSDTKTELVERLTNGNIHIGRGTNHIHP